MRGFASIAVFLLAGCSALLGVHDFDGGTSFEDAPGSCGTGFMPSDAGCVDVDECTDSAVCPVACQNTPGSFTCYTPASCADLHARGVPSGDAVLYVGGDTAKPWNAYCDGAATYLSVPPATNFSQYTAGGSSPGTSVRTTFGKIRIDPESLVVDIADHAYASSTGSLEHAGTTQVTSMPYGVAMNCVGDNSATGVASLDLSGTGFTIASTFILGGSHPSGATMFDAAQARASLTGGGNCGWNAVTGVGANPFNTIADGALLQLSYGH